MDEEEKYGERAQRERGFRETFWSVGGTRGRGCCRCRAPRWAAQLWPPAQSNAIHGRWAGGTRLHWHPAL